MINTLRGVSIALCAILALTLAQAPAIACSCMPTSREQAIAMADLVFVGKARYVWSATENGMPMRLAKMRIYERIKGRLRAKSLTIRTPESSATCGYGFVPGRVETIGANRGDDGRWRTNLCLILGLNH
jgi:hypothetical protein